MMKIIAAWTIGIALIVAVAVGVIIGEGWLLFLVYNAVAPESWVYLDFWPAVGIAFLLTALFGGSGASARCA